LQLELRLQQQLNPVKAGLFFKTGLFLKQFVATLPLENFAIIKKKEVKK